MATRRAADRRAWALPDLPRPEASRHPQHRRQSGRGACSARAGNPDRSRRRRDGDAGRGQEGGAAGNEGRRGDRAHQPRRSRPCLHGRPWLRLRIRSCASPCSLATAASTGSSARAPRSQRSAGCGRRASSSCPGVRPAAATSATRSASSPRAQALDGRRLRARHRPADHRRPDPVRAIMDIDASLTHMPA